MSAPNSRPVHGLPATCVPECIGIVGMEQPPMVRFRASAHEETGEQSMKAKEHPSPDVESPSQQIDAIIRESGDWRGKMMSRLRAVIKEADPGVVEEVKWKKPSN